LWIVRVRLQEKERLHGMKEILGVRQLCCITFMIMGGDFINLSVFTCLYTSNEFNILYEIPPKILEKMYSI
jgi:hypothetical protein